ncbi:unnamed protein product [Lepidochelys kempii]
MPRLQQQQLGVFLPGTDSGCLLSWSQITGNIPALEALVLRTFAGEHELITAWPETPGLKTQTDHCQCSTASTTSSKILRLAEGNWKVFLLKNYILAFSFVSERS